MQALIPANSVPLWTEVRLGMSISVSPHNPWLPLAEETSVLQPGSSGGTSSSGDPFNTGQPTQPPLLEENTGGSTCSSVQESVYGSLNGSGPTTNLLSIDASAETPTEDAQPDSLG